MDTPEHAVQPYEPEDIGEFIRFPKRIAQLLEQIEETRALLTVVLLPKPQRYMSAVLRVDRGQHAFYIDELNPKTGHERLHAGMQVRFFTALRGVAIAFNARVQGKGEHEGVGFYRIAFPEELHYRQRRGHFRARAVGQIPVQLDHEAREDQPALSISGMLHDISTGGVGLLIPEGSAIEAESVFDRCAIEAPEWGFIRSPLRICHLVPGRGKYTFVGAEWLEPDRLARSAIERFVLALEREDLKRQGNG